MTRTNAPGRHAERPVFVDRSGRRRRVFVAAGATGATATAVAVGALLLALAGGGGQAPPGLPDAHVPHGGSQSAVPERTPPTTTPAAPGATASAVPGPAATPAPTTTPSAAASPTHPGNGHRHTPTQTPSHGKK